MNDDRNATMADALRLTRDGRLMEATALLQQGLGGAGQSMPAQLVPAWEVARPDRSASSRRLARQIAGPTAPRTTRRTARQLPLGPA